MEVKKEEYYRRGLYFIISLLNYIGYYFQKKNNKNMKYIINPSFNKFVSKIIYVFCSSLDHNVASPK